MASLRAGGGGVRAVALGICLGLPPALPGAVFDWSSSPINNDWAEEANWDGPVGFPDIFDTANVGVVPPSGFQPRLETTVDIDTLNISNGASVHTGNAQLFTFNLNLADAGSRLTVFNGPEVLDAVVEDVSAATGGIVDMLGGTLRVFDQLEIAAGSSLRGFGRVELDADQANIPSNHGAISALGGTLIIDEGPAATRLLDLDGNDTGSASLSAELGGTLEIRMDQTAADPFDGTIVVDSGSTFRNQFDWSQNFGRNTLLNPGGGAGTATIAGGTFFSFGNVFIQGGTGRFDAFFHGRFGTVQPPGAKWSVHDGIFDDNDGSQEVNFILQGNNEWIVDGNFVVNEQGFTFDWDGATEDLTTTVQGSLASGAVLTINADQIESGNPATAGYDGVINLNEATLNINTATPWRMNGVLNLNGQPIGAAPRLNGSQVRVGGTVNARGPALPFAGSSTINSPITLLAGGTLNVADGHRLNQTEQLTVDAGGTVNVNGTLNVAGGGPSWTNGGTLQLEAAQVTGRGILNTGLTRGYGTITLAGDFINNGTLDAEGTALEHTLVFDGTGNLDLDGTTGNGLVDATFGNLHIVQPLGAAVFDGELTIGVLRDFRIDDGWLDNTGVVHINGGNYIASRFQQSGTLLATSDFTGAIMADSLFRAGSTTTVDGPNFGGLRLIGNTVIEAGATFIGNDPISLEGGTAVLSDGADVGLPVSNHTDLDLGTSPGQATVARFAQQATGRLHFEVGGLLPGTEFDQLVVDNNAALDGTLLVSLIDAGGGFPVFSPGDMLPILTAGGGLGGTTFATELLPLLPGGLALDVAYTATAVTLVVEGIPGDYNRDGRVDAGDYPVWRDSLGQIGVGLAADGNGDRQVDADDYEVWSTNFGTSAGAGSGIQSAALPEPGSLSGLLCLALCGLGGARGRIGPRQATPRGAG